MKKVKLTREVAEAIEYITSAPNGQEWNINTIRSNANHTPESSYGVIWRWIIREGDVKGIPRYFEVLINGYEVEQTPEEKLREYYTKTDPLREPASIYRDRVYAERHGIEQTLDILGIKVEGINANKTEGDE